MRILRSIDQRLTPPMAWAEIDLKALAHNFNEIRKAAGSQLKILCVVKADAYGHGSIAISKLLERKGVDFLAISDLHEGVLLRKAGIRTPILMVENTLPSHAKYLVKHNITPIVCTKELALALNVLGAQKRKKIAIHIKVDTGMGRLGVSPDDAFAFAYMLTRLPWISLKGVCTHFPLSDSDPDFTRRQQKTFLFISCAIQEKLNASLDYVHASNSIGIVAYPNKKFSMVRAGLILYGMYPSDKIKAKISLEPVMSVRSRITFVKDIKRNAGVSYGHRFVASRAMKIATVAIGYSDGYFRVFSNKAHVLVHGKRCPVLGTVTMDQIMIDVSHLRNVRAGDDVCVLGRQGKEEISADELAKIAGTINYEITCALGSRLPRVFVHGKSV